MNRFYERIDNIDNIDTLSVAVCEEYNLGKLISTELIEIGYEDFNAIIRVDSGKYLMKVFRNPRSDDEVKECIERTNIAGINGVPTPKVYKNSKGELFSVFNIDSSRFRVAVLEYINGQNFFELKGKPNNEELEVIVDIASKLSKIDYKPTFVYDTWALTSFCNEFERKRSVLSSECLELIEPIYNDFKNFDYDSLPKSYVHGDMRSTNLMKDINGKIWLIDFSVSNYTARLNEIVVICDDIALLNGEKEESEKRVKHAFESWCDKVSATELEKRSFKLLFDVANAINIMNTNYQIYNGNTSEETEMHLKAGIFGLSLFS
jgi:Ser/Thr protein kinase RdoA (MazF antagonist)